MIIIMFSFILLRCVHAVAITRTAVAVFMGDISSLG
jgi:hypothetical protein